MASPANESIRLSQSPLWERQRAFFEKAGLTAWRNNIVPSYVTTNPFITGCYVTLVENFILDCRAHNGGVQEDPIYIIDLGAGSGAFAYSFLKTFAARYQETEAPPIRYIITDYVAGNLAAIREHESFQPFIADGRLDFAIFDAQQSTELELLISKRRLTIGSLTSSMVVIGNYFFDSIAVDLFEVRNHQLFECLTSYTGNNTQSDQTDDLADIELQYQLRPCLDNYYSDSNWNEILQDYPRILKESFFAFPTIGLTLLARLRDLTTGQFLFLTADKGYSQPEEMEGRTPFQPTKHGSISISVNFHALAAYSRLRGGSVLDTEQTHSSIKVLGLLFCDCDFSNTRRAYQQAVENFGPDDFFMIKKIAEQNYHNLSLPQIFSLLRLSNWDKAIFLGCYDRLVELLPTASQLEKKTFAAAARQIWAQYLPLRESEDLAFCLGCLLGGCGNYQQAIDFLEISLKLYGEDEATLKNLANCRKRLVPDKQ